MGKPDGNVVVVCRGLLVGRRGNAVGYDLEPGCHRRYELAHDEVWLAGFGGVELGFIRTPSDFRAGSPNNLGAACFAVSYHRHNLGV